MKKSSRKYLTALSVVAVIGFSAQADIVKLAEIGVDPAAVVGISGVINHSGVLAGQYKLKAEDASIIDAFCVDPQYSTTGKLFDYTMIDVSGRYTKAAWLWENMSTLGNDAVATQLAIWEVTWENDGAAVDLSAGRFILNTVDNNYSKNNAINMLNALAAADLTSFSAEGYRVVVSSETQDYLIKHSVPEPGSTFMLLMGIVCIGLVGYRRKIS